MNFSYSASSPSVCHSLLKLSTGLARAARRWWLSCRIFRS